MAYFNFSEWLNIVEKAALSCYSHIGQYNEKLADQAAVECMRAEFNKLPYKIRIAIGEGERDKAPMLYIGELLGQNYSGAKEQEFDIAIDPLEGTTLCAHNMPNSMSVMAVSESGGFLHAPDLYMNKIAFAGQSKENIVDLDYSIKQNLENIASFKNCKISDLTIALLKRDRHLHMIQEVVQAGAKIKLFTDGDIAAAIATMIPKSGIDLYVGIGGAPEGVLAAAAMKALGGTFQGRLLTSNKEEEDYALRLGIKDISRKYNENELVPGQNIAFFATGITDGFLMNGVKQNEYGGFTTDSIIISSDKQAIQYIKNEYRDYRF